MTRGVIGVVMGLVLAGCSSLLPPTPTPVNFILPTPTTVVTPTPSPTNTPEPTTEADTQPVRLLNPDAAAEEVVFDGEAGERITVRAVPEDGAPLTRLAVIDRFGNTVIEVVAGAAGEAAVVDSLLLPYSGLYRVALSTEGQAGAVRLAIENLSEPAPIEQANLLNGVEISFGAGSFGAAYGVELQAGQHLRLVSTAEGVTMRLHGIDGDEVLQATGESPPFTVEQSGPYMLLVTASGPGEAFSVQAVDVTQIPVAEGSPDLQIGQALNARFVEGDPLEVTFDGRRGEVIAVRAFDLSGDFALDLEVQSPFGQGVAFATGEEGAEVRLSELQLPYDGRYTLIMRSRGEGQAAFVVEALPQEALTGGGTFGPSREGVLAGIFSQPGAFHVAQFEATYGEVVTLAVRDLTGRADFAPAIALIGPDGWQTAFAIRSDEGMMPRIMEYAIEQNGRYTVIVYTTSEVGGRYEIILLRQ